MATTSTPTDCSVAGWWFKAHLNGYDCFRCCEAEHWEQIDNRVRAPTDHGHNLRRVDLLCNLWVGFTGGGSCKAHQKLVHDVQEEAHGEEPTHPSWGQITSNDE